MNKNYAISLIFIASFTFSFFPSAVLADVASFNETVPAGEILGIEYESKQNNLVLKLRIVAEDNSPAISIFVLDEVSFEDYDYGKGSIVQAYFGARNVTTATIQGTLGESGKYFIVLDNIANTVDANVSVEVIHGLSGNTFFVTLLGLIPLVLYIHRKNKR